jgi:hypothetical protein
MDEKKVVQPQYFTEKGELLLLPDELKTRVNEVRRDVARSAIIGVTVRLDYAPQANEICPCCSQTVMPSVEVK